MRIKDFLRFAVCAVLFIFGVLYLFNANPPNPKKNPDDLDKKEVPRPRGKLKANPNSVVGSLAGPFAALAGHVALEKLEELRRKELAAQPPPPPPPSKRITLGSAAADS